MPEKADHEELRKKIQQLEGVIKQQEVLRTRLAVAIEIAQLGPWEYDVAEARFTFNHHFYRMLRTTVEEVGDFTMSYEKYARSFLPPSERTRLEEEMRKAIETADAAYSRQLDHRILYGDGTSGYTTTRFSIVKDPSGSTVRVYGVNQDITQRKHFEEALRENEGYLRSLLRALPDLVWLKDPDGVYISCNSRFEKFFGAEEKDVVGKTDYDFVDRELAHFFRKHDKAAIAKGSPTVNEEEITFADDGHREILETIKTPMFGSDGRLIGVLGIGRNITERKRMESALTRRIDFEQIMSRISSDLAGAGSENVDTVINKTLAQVGTFTKADRAYVFQFQDDPALMDNTHEWCAGGIEPQIQNLKNINLDDNLPWFAERIRTCETFYAPDVGALPPEARRERLHFEAQGIQSLIVVPIETADKLNGFIGFDAVRRPRLWDKDDRNILRFLGETLGHVLERKMTEKALRESEARWQFALEGAGDGVWDLNVLTGHIYYSSSLKAMLGYSDEEIGTTLNMLEEIIHPDDRDALICKKEHHLLGNRPIFQSEHRIRCKDGSYKWILARGKEIEWTEDGKPMRVIGTHTDISVSKQQQQERERLIGELQKALEKVKQLSGMLPICSYCKKVKDDKGYWKQIETYIQDHSEAEFSHGICSNCAEKYHPEYFKSRR